MLNIIIPVYNEGIGILKTLEEIDTKVKTPRIIYIVYDFEEDTTLPFLRKNMRNNIRLVKNKYGHGALNAIKTGLETPEEGACLVTMADLSDDYATVDQMYRLIENGFDIVCGSRYMSGGRQIGGALIKKSLSKLAGISLYYFTGISTHDATNSFKMYSQNVIKKIKIESTGGFELGLELVVKAHRLGYKITEVPSTWRDRTSGKSNFKLIKWLPKYLFWYFYALKTRYSKGVLNGK